MRTFGMWLLAGLFLLAGWDAVERLDGSETRPDAPVVEQGTEATALEDGTTAPPPPHRAY